MALRQFRTLRFEQSGERLSGARKPETELRTIEIAPERRGSWRVEEEFVRAIRGEQPVRLTTFADGVRYIGVHRGCPHQQRRRPQGPTAALGLTAPVTPSCACSVACEWLG